MRDYRLVDYLTQGYLLVIALLVLFLHGEGIPAWPAYVVGHVVVIALVHGIIRFGSRRTRGFLHILRCFYPIILYTFLYSETHDLDSMIYPSYLDPVFIHLEQVLFGGQPSRDLMRNFPSLAISELLHFAYFSYYWMVLGVAVWMYLRRRERYFHYVSVLSLVFYACYLTYIFLPVMGPHGNWVATAPPAVHELLGDRCVPPALTRGPFFHVMQFVYHFVEPTGGAAFPSSHVAIALVTLAFTFGYLHKLWWVHLVMVLLLCISTVYCGYHYAVDVMAGVATAAVLGPAAHMLCRRLGECPPLRWEPSGRDEPTPD